MRMFKGGSWLPGPTKCFQRSTLAVFYISPKTTMAILSLHRSGIPVTEMTSLFCYESNYCLLQATLGSRDS